MVAEAIDQTLLEDGDTADQELARRSLIDFTRYTFPGYIDNWFGTKLANDLEQFLKDVMAGLSPRLMIAAPPRHGKSELVSRRFPAWALGKHPDIEIIAASYGPDLAYSMSQDVKEIMDGDAYARIFPHIKLPAAGRTNSEGKKRRDDFWELLEQTGSYRARGVGQGVSGHGANIFIIDDAYKDLDEARSEARQNQVWRWFRAVALTRLEPGAGMLVMNTRWNAEDLSGKIIDAMRDGSGEVFDQITYPAIATEDEEHRKEGEALVPHRYPIEVLKKRKASLGDYVFSALFQQDPSIEGGDVFEDDWWQYYGDVKPRIVYRLIFGDTAQKTKEVNDYSVFQCWGLGVDGRIYLLDQIRDKWKAPELLTQATGFWDKWSPPGKDHEITRKIYIEDKVSGTGLIQQLETREHDPEGKKGAIPVEGIQRNIDKVIRADDGAPQIKAGNVVLPERAHWLSDYKAEFSKFTREMSHKHDDQIDPTLDAISVMLTQGVDLYAGALS